MLRPCRITGICRREPDRASSARAFGPVSLACLALTFSAGCSSEGEAAAASNSASAAPASSETAAPTATAIVVQHDPAATEACNARRAELQKQEALPGSKAVTERAVGFARVRSRAALWRREPEVPPQLEKLGRGKRSSLRLVRAVRELLNKKGPKEDKRKAVLSEGYLFADNELVALALGEQVSLTKLFEEQTLYLQRGLDLYELVYEPQTKLEKERYVYKGGAYDGEKAELLFGDRVATTKEELEGSPSLTIDLRDLMNRSAFDRIKPIHLTESALVAEVRYGAGTWVPAVIDLKGSKADLGCEALTPELAAAKGKFVNERATYRRAMENVRATVRKMVREKMPFDAAPDQKNGFLRKAWKRAYLAGWRSYQFEGESHDVYTSKGDPRPPQVCIDFLTDVWERSSGTWYQPAVFADPLEPQPKRTEGAIDFDAMKIGNRRSVAEFTDFAERNTELFDVLELPKSERIPFKEREAFFDYLAKKADNFIPGDMITVHGFKEGGRPHYHSLIIVETDPITGIPTLVAGNAVFPREQSLDGILQISPKRSLKHRIRVRDKWLKAVADAGTR
ncbi:MAG: hypothetical protein HOW73_42460 [Polyangiaceae bacterium]|nr:hypothetical protein [Polyangiaceae bacterium]